MSTNECTDREFALATTVALERPSSWPVTLCVAWVESSGQTCGRIRAEGLLCKRHHGVAEKRYVKAVEKASREREKRAEWRAESLPKWRAELARVEARMNVLDPPRPADRAAYTGCVHPSITKRRRAFMSDSRVMEMGTLSRRAQELRSLIGDPS